MLTSGHVRPSSEDNFTEEKEWLLYFLTGLWLRGKQQIASGRLGAIDLCL